MADLVAQGPESNQRWRRKLTADSFTLGRGTSGWAVDWDPLISRAHVQLQLTEGRLHVRRLESATNPVFFHGKKLPEFFVSVGEHFVIGQTKFMLTGENVRVTMDLPQPDAEKTFAPDQLRSVDYRDAGQKIAVLGQLPDVISRAANDEDLHACLINILLNGIRRATTIGIVQYLPDESLEQQINMLHWDRRLQFGGDFQPSGTLIRKAIDRQETILHSWQQSSIESSQFESTVLRSGDWAFVTPLRGRTSSGLAIYVAGNRDLPVETAAASDLYDDIKFAELIAATLANLRDVKQLERSQASLRSFFSPIVLDAIANQDPETVLAPRQCEVSVLFCDLHGFSLKSERLAKNLHELLDRVSQALGVTTNQILEQRGVVGDFHGDAAMGFWGWPLAQADRTERACLAALEIQRQFCGFAKQTHHPLRDFRIGLGIATGTAVAGKIGTDDQVKVSAFGPVVNIASRLENMTRHFRVGVLADQRTDEIIRQGNMGDLVRVRRLAVVQPYGMENAITVSEVIPPKNKSFEYGLNVVLTDHHISMYEQALDLFTAGNWSEAFDILNEVPNDDLAKDFLTVYIAQHNRQAPDDWPGFVAFQRK